MGGTRPRDNRCPLARSKQNPSYASPCYHDDASKIPPRLIFDHADILARRASRPQTNPSQPSRTIRHADRHIRGASGAASTRSPASATNPVHLPRRSGISALYGRRILERHAQQARQGLRPARMGTARGLAGSDPPAETASHSERPFRDTVSRRALNRKACPRINAQTGMRFPLEPQAETASQNPRPKRDTLSATATAGPRPKPLP